MIAENQGNEKIPSKISAEEQKQGGHGQSSSNQAQMPSDSNPENKYITDEMSPESKKSNGNICTLCYQIVKEKNSSSVKCKGVCKRIFHHACAKATFKPDNFQKAPVNPKNQMIEDDPKSDLSEESKGPNSSVIFTCDICILHLASCYICKKKSAI